MQNKQAKRDTLTVLMDYCPELFSGYAPIAFRHFLCPIAIMEADVEEYVVDEYDSVELLVLRLYDAGIRDPEGISSLTNIDAELIKKIINSEKYIYAHIDPRTGEITDMGRITLTQNKDMEHLFYHALFHVKRELQVDAVTGTLIRAEAERLKSNMKIYNTASNEDMPDVLPNESVELDEELTSEIHQRLQYYIDEDYFSEGNTIKEIKALRTDEIRYRDAYYVHVRNFDYPFLAIKYKKYAGGKKEEVVTPIAISASDAKKIGANKIGGKYLVRRDVNFRYLKSLQTKFEP